MKYIGINHGVCWFGWVSDEADHALEALFSVNNTRLLIQAKAIAGAVNRDARTATFITVLTSTAPA
jgi:hypothetical protein